MRARCSQGGRAALREARRNVAAARAGQHDRHVRQALHCGKGDRPCLRSSRVLGLILRQVIGWAMRDHADTDLVLQALLSAAWRRKPKPGALIHSDHGSSTPATIGGGKEGRLDSAHHEFVYPVPRLASRLLL